MKRNQRRHLSFAQPQHSFHAAPLPYFIRIGRLEGPQRYVKLEHPHAENEWLYILKGRLRVWISGEELEAGPGDLYFIQPGQTHREESLREPLDFYALRFQLCALTGKRVHFIPPPSAPARQVLRKAGPPFAHLFAQIFQEVWAQEPGGLEVVEALLLQLLWRVRRRLHLIGPQSASHLQQRRRALVEHAQQHILAHLNRSLSLDELGRACCASPDHLRHLFKATTGLSPMQYAAGLRMQEARRLLVEEPALAVYQVAQRLGFEDPYHFSRRFKTFTGTSPRAFRKPTR